VQAVRQGGLVTGISAMACRSFLFSFLLAAVPVYAGPGKITVFVSVAPQKQFVERIGGEFVEVHVLLPAGQSPETYAPSPRMLGALAGARLYFQIGVPFEKNWTSAIKSVNPGIRIVPCCEQYLRTGSAAGSNADLHDMHIWTSPAYVKALAKDIRDALVSLVPDQKTAILSGYDSFIADLDRLDSDIRRKLRSRRTDYFIVSHAAWSYFAEGYGLQQLSLERNGKESGPRSVSSLIRIAKNEGLRTVFVQQQYETPFVKSLVAELDARIVRLDPLAEDYLENMRLVSGRIATALDWNDDDN